MVVFYNLFFILAICFLTFPSSYARTKRTYDLISSCFITCRVVFHVTQITDFTLLYCETYTETVVVTVPIAAVEVEYSSARPTVKVTSTKEERVLRIHKEGEIAIPSTCFCCCISCNSRISIYC